MTIQIISKDNKIVCKTTVPYPPQTIREMKKGGYKVKECVPSPDIFCNDRERED